MTSDQPSIRKLATNRRARHDYHVRERLEAGLVLTGTEVKAARSGRVQLKDGYVEFRNGEAYLVGVHISPYSHGNRQNHEPERPRKLLLHRRELGRLFGRVQAKGFTIVPLAIYLKGHLVKVEIALVVGKKVHDKRQVERERELEREAREAMKTGRGRG